MRSSFLLRTRKWIGASALAILVGIGGGTAFLAASSPMAAAQVTPAAQIITPTPVGTTGFADLVDAVKPAVVSIVVEGREKSTQLQNDGNQFDPRLPDLPDDNPLKKFFDQFGKGGGNGRGNGPQGNMPQGQKYVAAGSGFVISADGYIVTNNHVVENATKVTVTFDNGTQKSAKIVGTDSRTDLAVVKVDGDTSMPFVKFAPDDVRVGDWVVAVGNPFGLGGTVTAGIVSARGRDVAGSAYGDFLQIDAAINMGNSGGPAFNLKGEVVGVNTEIFSPNGGNVGIAFAIPAKTVEQITASLIKTGTVTRGFLGVSIQDVTRDIADSVGLKDPKGALITQLNSDSPGGKAGSRVTSSRRSTAPGSTMPFRSRAQSQARRPTPRSSSQSVATARRSRSKQLWARSRKHPPTSPTSPLRRPMSRPLQYPRVLASPSFPTLMARGC